MAESNATFQIFEKLNLMGKQVDDLQQETREKTIIRKQKKELHNCAGNGCLEKETETLSFKACRRFFSAFCNQLFL